VKLISEFETKESSARKSHQITNILLQQPGQKAWEAVILPEGSDDRRMFKHTITAYIPSCRAYVTDSSLNSLDQYRVLNICRYSNGNYGGRKPLVNFTAGVEIMTGPITTTRRATRNAALDPIASLLSDPIGWITLAIIGGLTHLSRGTACTLNRFRIMTWICNICFGCFLGPLYSAAVEDLPFIYTPSVVIPETRSDRTTHMDPYHGQAYCGFLSVCTGD
jgi:hypothetical protein